MMLFAKRVWFTIVLVQVLCIGLIWYAGVATRRRTSQSDVAMYTRTTGSQEVKRIEAGPGAVQMGTWGGLYCEDREFKLYVYSAFYDDRELVEKTGPAVVRLSGSARYRAKDSRHSTNVALYCILTYAGDPEPDVVKVTGQKSSNPRVCEGVICSRAFIYSCPIDRNAVPTVVSLVCSERDVPGYYMPVQIPQKPQEKQEFAICVCASYDSRDPYYLVEWMELQQLLGVSKVTVYNHSISDETSGIFLHYVREGLVDFRQTRAFGEDFGSSYNRSWPHKVPTINDCLYRNMYSFKKIIVLDFDEVIVPLTNGNISALLTEIDSAHPNEQPARGYVFQNAHFPLELPTVASAAPKLATLSYRYHLEGENSTKRWIKSIVDPLACTRMHQHCCLQWTQHHTNTSHTINVERTLAVKHHYSFYCEQNSSEFNCPDGLPEVDYFQDDTMLRFRDRLLPRVRIQLQRLGLDPFDH